MLSIALPSRSRLLHLQGSGFWPKERGTGAKWWAKVGIGGALWSVLENVHSRARSLEVLSEVVDKLRSSQFDDELLRSNDSLHGGRLQQLQSSFQIDLNLSLSVEVEEGQIVDGISVAHGGGQSVAVVSSVQVRLGALRVTTTLIGDAHVEEGARAGFTARPELHRLVRVVGVHQRDGHQIVQLVGVLNGGKSKDGGNVGLILAG